MLNNKAKWSSARRPSKEIPIGRNAFFIYCGEQTEKNYFQYYLSMVHQNWAAQTRHTTQFLWSDEVFSQDPAKMADEAETIIEKRKALTDVFVVFDRDDFPRDNFDNAVKKLVGLSKKGVKVWPLWSNECFELWFLLHFEFFHSNCDRNQYFHKLGEHLGTRYVKNDKRFVETMQKAGGSLKTAMTNAVHLHQLHSSKTPCSRRCPDTVVDDFFLEFKQYIK